MDTLLTLGPFCKYADISSPTARRYADAGWVDCFRDSSGRRLFPEHAVEQARLVKASRARKSAPQRAPTGNNSWMSWPGHTPVLPSTASYASPAPSLYPTPLRPTRSQRMRPVLPSSPAVLKYWLLSRYRVVLFLAWTAFGRIAHSMRNAYFRLEGKHFGGIEYADYEAVPDTAIAHCPLCNGPVE